MMLIKDNTWHFKLWKLYHNLVEEETGFSYTEDQARKSTDLCTYMRTLMLFLPARLFIFVLSLLSPILAPALYWITAPEGYASEGMLEFLSVLLIVIVACAVLLGSIAFIGDVLIPSIRNRYSEYKHGYTEDRAPNIFFEWFKAKKEKYCPVVTFQEKEDA